MESNPYAAPSAVVEDAVVFGRDDLEARKAGRGVRLGAVLLDGLFFLLCMAPFVFVAAQSAIGHSNSFQSPPSRIMAMLFAIAGAAILVLVVVNFVLLHRYGQTLGKRLMGIKIVRSNGERVSLLRVIFARVIPISLLGRIPVIGLLITLIDPLLIFGAEKRCLHDLIADTIVIDA